MLLLHHTTFNALANCSRVFSIDVQIDFALVFMGISKVKKISYYVFYFSFFLKSKPGINFIH
ncbi:uncharacterized protein Dvar_43110 [Desulfosarcina variabilis str. Montpellier]